VRARARARALKLTRSSTDIVAAVAVSALTFPAHKDVTAFREWEDVWSSPALVGEFGDLVAWRDDVYARFR